MVAQVALNHLDIGTYELSSLGFKLLHLPFGSGSEFDTTVNAPFILAVIHLYVARV